MAEYNFKSLEELQRADPNLADFNDVGLQILKGPNDRYVLYTGSNTGMRTQVGSIDPNVVQQFTSQYSNVPVKDLSNVRWDVDTLRQQGYDFSTSGGNVSSLNELINRYTSAKSNIANRIFQQQEEQRAKLVNDFIAANKNTKGVIPVPYQPGYVIKDGVFMQESRANLPNYENDPNYMKVPIGSGFGYIPKGSAAEANYNNPVTQPTATSTTQPTMTTGITRNLVAEQEFVKSWQGKEGRLPTPQEVNQAVYGTPNPQFNTPQGGQTSPLAEGRLLGPTEYKSLREKFGATPDNFDQYFTRDAQGNIYLKPNVDTGVINTASGAVGQLPSNTTTGDLGSRTLLDNEALKSSSSDVFGDLGVDFGSFLQQQQALMTQAQQGVITAEQQLANIRNQANQSLLALESQPIPTGFIVGQSREQLRLYQAAEANALANLGIAQTKVDQIYQNFGVRLEVEGLLMEKEEQLFNRIAKLQSNARTTLTSILGELNGVEMSDLTPQGQTELTNLAAQAGIPISLLSEAMSLQKAQVLGNNLDDRFLTLEESQQLNLPFGTTLKEARAMGVVPEEQFEYDKITIGDEDYFQVGNTLVPAKDYIPVSEEAKQQARLVQSLVVDLFNDTTLNSAIGPIQGRLPAITKNVSDFRNKVTQLKSLLTLENLDLMSGVLSETDIKILESAATNLNVTTSEDAFRKELKRIYNTATNSLNTIRRPSATTILDDVVRANPDILPTIESIERDNPNITDADILEILGVSFNGVGGDTNTATKKTSFLNSLGSITAYGSPLWKWGLDIDLQKGDAVKSPVSGRVIAVGENKGFGRQVKIKGVDGREYWLSHLDKFAVRNNQNIRQGEIIGLGGNTGKVIARNGGDGSHLDLTVKDIDGSFMKPQNIEQLVKNRIV